MTSIFEGQPPKTRPFPTKIRVIWVPGIYTVYIAAAFFAVLFQECQNPLAHQNSNSGYTWIFSWILE